MADNMIELIARLDTDTSAGEINKTDIPNLQKQINKLQIKCNLDTGSINALKNQFSKLSTSFGSTGIKKVTDDIVKKFNDSFNMVGKVSEESKKQFNAQTKQLLQEFKDAWNKGMESGDFSGYENILDKLDQRVREFNRGDIQQLKQNIAEIRSFFTDGSKVSIGSNLKGWLDNATGSNSLTREYLDAIYGKNNYTIGAGNSGFDTLLKKDEDAAESIINSAQKIIEYQKKIRSTGWALDELEEIGYNTKEYLEAQERASNNIEDKLREIVGLSQRIRTSEEQWFDIDSDYSNVKQTNELSESYKEAAEQSNSLHMQQELLQQSYEKLTERIKKAKLNIDEVATREEYLTGEIVNYNEKFKEIMSEEIVDASELDKARKLYNAINNEFGILNAQMSSEIPSNVLENLALKISKVDSQIKLATADYKNLINVPSKLKISYENLQTAMDGFDFSSDFKDKSKEEITSMLQQYTQIRVALTDVESLIKVAQQEEKKYVNELDSHNKEIQKRLELKEAEVQKAKELKNVENEKAMSNYWQGRFEETIKAQTAENEVLKQMKKYYEDLNKEIKQDSALETHRNRIEKLSATMTVFAEKNERAVKSVQLMSSGKTFAQEWQELSDTLSKGNLSPDELKHLQERFAIFGKEAEAAGLKGKTAWEKFLNTFKTFSSYITANMVFNAVKRQIRSMVQEVVNLDSAMTELRKVTEASEAEFNKFLETAKVSAQNLGSSVTDLVDATSTFSRLGYSLQESQKLGEIATLYKNVGDGIDISTASETLVSTLKAFKEFNNEATDAITIVDKLNEVGNNFAISSGGIGEALLRSASALATANNDLSQSIALITTANTIAQDPQAVGTGLKTMALRLRSTKTELEEMGEDAEGAAENVSKLREQVLALTKGRVDIQLDENTYKSSYEILLEISKVWNDINDISRASLLEQLFGKRQANIGSAILENGDLLQEVYEKAEHSINSATKEQDKFAKSIQYSINSFKATYQTLASDLVDSGFVKEIVDLGSTIVKGLDFIITKTGILQGILVGFGSLAIFKTIPALITKIKTLGTSLTAFSAIMNTLGASGGGGQIMTLQQLSLTSKQLTDRQFELVLSTKSLTAAQLTAMMQARGFTQEQINAQLAIRNQTIATNGLATAERGATATTFTLSGALKGLGAVIAANPIGAIVTAVTLLATALTSLKRKREEAIVEAKRLEEERQQNLQTTLNEIKSLENEQDSIDGLIKRYTTLYNTTENIASKKDELTSITDELNEKFGNEKEQIDLVNNSISENIELIRQQQLALDKQWQRDHADDVKEAEKYFADNASLRPAYWTVQGVKLGENTDEATQEAKFYFERMKNLIESENKDLWKYFETYQEEATDRYGYIWRSYGFKLKEGIEKDVIPQALKSFRELYEQLDKYSYIGNKWFTGTGDMEALNQYISDSEKYLELIQKNAEINNELFDNTSITIDGTIQKFNDLADAASKASQKMNAENALPADVYMYSRQISDIKDKMEELAKASPELQKRLELIFSTIGLKAEDVSESADLLNKKFFDTLDEMEKGVFDKVDKINEALTKVLSGEGLESAEAWELIEFDTTGILNPIIDANGKWIMQSEELVALKERLVGLSREQVQKDLETARKQVADLDKQIADQYAIIKKQQEIIYESAHGNTKPNEENVRALSQAKEELNRLLSVQKKYSEEIKRDNLLLQELNNRLRLSVEQAQKVADAYAKAFTNQIDGIIDGLQKEADALNEEKSGLQEQLDLLEAQRDEIESILDNYKEIASIIEDEVNKEIDAIKEQQKAQEDAYNARIDALKKENEEREDALEYAQKLANLENAKNNKVRVIDATRGFRYESIKEDVVKAENDLADFENNRAIKALEEERDESSKIFDTQIKEYEDYLEYFKEIQDEETKAENERLMAEAFGSDWREKIKEKDTLILQKYQNDFRNYNTQLANLTNNEIASLKKSIEAKENEIKVKEKQIKSWKTYKSEVETAIKTVNDKYDEYMTKLNDVNLSEGNRETALSNFISTYEGYVSQIQGLQDQIQDTTVGLYIDTNVDEVKDKFLDLFNTADDWANYFKTIRDSDEAEKALMDYAIRMTNGMSPKPAPKLAPKSAPKSLYSSITANPITVDVTPKRYGAPPITSTNTATTINNTVNVDKIVTDNPQDFARQLDRYYQTKLTESYTNK